MTGKNWRPLNPGQLSVFHYSLDCQHCRVFPIARQEFDTWTEGLWKKQTNFISSAWLMLKHTIAVHSLTPHNVQGVLRISGPNPCAWPYKPDLCPLTPLKFTALYFPMVLLGEQPWGRCCLEASHGVVGHEVPYLSSQKMFTHQSLGEVVHFSPCLLVSLRYCYSFVQIITACKQWLPLAVRFCLFGPQNRCPEWISQYLNTFGNARISLSGR